MAGFYLGAGVGNPGLTGNTNTSVAPPTGSTNNRLPGFAHFESSFGLSGGLSSAGHTNGPTTSTPNVVSAECLDQFPEVLDLQASSYGQTPCGQLGLDLSLGLDLTNQNHYSQVLNLTQQCLNLSSNPNSSSSSSSGRSTHNTIHTTHSSQLHHATQQQAHHHNGLGLSYFNGFKSTTSVLASGLPTVSNNTILGTGNVISDVACTGGIVTSDPRPGTVLNLSTQIGLNLTRPGQESASMLEDGEEEVELDYSMLQIGDEGDEDGNATAAGVNTFAGQDVSQAGDPGGVDDEANFGYFGDYYGGSYPGVTLNIGHTEEQRASPLNLEHRNSPLNLTSVGNLQRVRNSAGAGRGKQTIVFSSVNTSKAQSTCNQTQALQNIQSNSNNQMQPGSDFINNQVFDYRIPNKLTAFYNQSSGVSGTDVDGNTLINFPDTASKTSDATTPVVDTCSGAMVDGGGAVTGANSSLSFDYLVGDGSGTGMAQTQPQMNANSADYQFISSVATPALLNGSSQGTGGDLTFGHPEGAQHQTTGKAMTDRMEYSGSTVAPPHAVSQDEMVPGQLDMFAGYTTAADQNCMLAGYGGGQAPNADFPTPSGSNLNLGVGSLPDQAAGVCFDNSYPAATLMESAATSEPSSNVVNRSTASIFGVNAAYTGTPFADNTAAASSTTSTNIVISNYQLATGEVGPSTSLQQRDCTISTAGSSSAVPDKKLVSYKSLEGRFSCELCRLHFMEESQLVSHNKMVHDSKAAKNQRLSSSRTLEQPSHEAKVVQSGESTANQPMNMTKEPIGKRIYEEKDSLSDAGDIASDCSSGGNADQLSPKNDRVQEEKERLAYECMICNQQFSSKDSLMTHLSDHNKAKPHTCQMCGKGFRHVSARRRHEKTHVNPRPHACQFCDRAFNRKGELTSHIARKHSHGMDVDSCVTEENGKRGHHDRKATDKTPAKTGNEIRKEGYECELCHHVLEKKMDWGVHMWKHTSDAAYIVLSENTELPPVKERDLMRWRTLGLKTTPPILSVK